MWSKLNYIYLNPACAGIVDKASHFVYSSTSNYAIGKGLVEVEIADNPIFDVHGRNEFWKYSNYEE